MAAKEISIILKAKDDASAAIRDVTHSIEGLKTPILAVTGLASALGAIALGRELVGGIKESIAAASDQEKADLAVAEAIRRVGGSVQTELPVVKALADKYRDLTGTQNQVIERGQALLISVGHLRGEGLERATAAALDMGVKFNNVEGAFAALAKASTGNTRGLREFLITLDAGTPKTLVLSEAIKKARQQFGGFAEAEMKTLDGAAKRVSLQFEELQKAFGRGIIESKEVREVLAFIVEELRNLTKALEDADSQKTIHEITTGLLTLADAGIFAARAVGAVAGIVVNLARGLTTLDFSHLTDFISHQPEYDKNLQALATRIESLRDHMDKGFSDKTARDISVVTQASAEAAVGLEKVHAATFLVDAGLTAVAVAAGVKLFGGLKKTVGATVDMVGGLAAVSGQSAKTGAELLRGLPALEAWTVATGAMRVGMVGATLAALGFGVALGTLLNKIPGVASAVEGFFSRAGESFQAMFGVLPQRVSDEMQQLADDVGFVEKAAAKLNEKGVILPVDMSKIVEAKAIYEKFKNETNVDLKVAIAADAAPLRQELAATSRELTELRALARDNGPAFDAAFARAAESGGNLRGIIDSVKASLSALPPVAAAAGSSILDALEAAAKAAGLKPYEQLVEEAHNIEKAFRAVKQELRDGLIPPALGLERLEELRKKAEKLPIRLDVTFQKPQDLDSLVKDLGVKLRVGLDTAELSKAIALVNANLAAIQGPNVGSSIEALKELKKQILDLAAAAGDPGVAAMIEPLSSAEEAAVHLQAGLKSLKDDDSLVSIGERGAEVGKLLRESLSLEDFPGIDKAKLEEIIKQLEGEFDKIRDAQAKAKGGFGTIDAPKVENIGGEFLPDVDKIQAALETIKQINNDYGQAIVDSGLATSDQVLAVEIDRINQEEALAADHAKKTIGDAQALQDALIQIAENAEIKRQTAARLTAQIRVQQELHAASAIAGSLASLFPKFKAFSIAAALIDAYAAALKVWNDPTPMPTYVRYAQTAAAIIYGIAQVNNIRKQGFAAGGQVPFEGGQVPGNDTGRDTVTAVTPAGKLFGVRPGELIPKVETSAAVIARWRAAGGSGPVAGPGGVGLNPSLDDFLLRGAPSSSAEKTPRGFATGGQAPGSSSISEALHLIAETTKTESAISRTLQEALRSVASTSSSSRPERLSDTIRSTVESFRSIERERSTTEREVARIIPIAAVVPGATGPQGVRGPGPAVAPGSSAIDRTIRDVIRTAERSIDASSKISETVRSASTSSTSLERQMARTTETIRTVLERPGRGGAVSALPPIASPLSPGTPLQAALASIVAGNAGASRFVTSSLASFSATNKLQAPSSIHAAEFTPELQRAAIAGGLHAPAVPIVPGPTVAGADRVGFGGSAAEAIAERSIPVEIELRIADVDYPTLTEKISAKVRSGNAKLVATETADPRTKR